MIQISDGLRPRQQFAQGAAAGFVAAAGGDESFGGSGAGEAFAGAGDGGVQQSAVEAAAGFLCAVGFLCALVRRTGCAAVSVAGWCVFFAGQQPDFGVFRALAFVDGDGEGGKVGGQAAEGDGAVAAGGGETGGQRAGFALRVGQDDADVAVVEAEGVVVAFDHDALSGKPGGVFAHAPLLREQAAAGLVEAVGLFAAGGEDGEAALRGEGGSSVARVGGLPEGGLGAAEAFGQLRDVVGQEGEFGGEAGELGEGGFGVAGAYGAGEAAEAAVFAEAVADGEAGGVGRERRGRRRGAGFRRPAG